jgi:hypothetical protein
MNLPVRFRLHVPTLRAMAAQTAGDSTRPILERVAIRLRGGTATYAACANSSCRMVKVLPGAPNNADIEVAVDVSALRRIASREEWEEAIIKEVGGGFAVIAAGVTLDCWLNDQHPALFDEPNTWAPSYSITAGDLLGVAEAIDHERGSAVLSGMVFRRRSDGQSVCAATDGKWLLEARCGGVAGTDDRSFVLPPQAIHAVRLLKLGDDQRITIETAGPANRPDNAGPDYEPPVRIVRLMVNGFTLTTRTIEGTFPFYENALRVDDDSSRCHLPICLAGLERIAKLPKGQSYVMLRSLGATNLMGTVGWRVGCLETLPLAVHVHYLSVAVGWLGEHATWRLGRALIGEHGNRRALLMPLAKAETIPEIPAGAPLLQDLVKPAKVAKAAAVEPGARILQATIDTLQRNQQDLIEANRKLTEENAALRNMLDALAVPV